MSQPSTAQPVGDLAAPILPPTHPVLLLPIRIETALDGNTLMIRVYPDEIHLDRRPTTDGGQPTARPRLLPDRFLATGWRDGARVFAVVGSSVSEDALRVGLDLSADDPTAGMAWLWDFGTAEQAGMALRVILDQPRLDRLLVFGVRDSLDADATQATLTDLLGARDDVRFVPPGDPTNDVAAAVPAAAGAVTTAPPATEATPTGTPAPGAAAAGPRLAGALGLATGSLDGVGGAEADEDSVAAAMHAALWPATWGYYLTHRLGGPGGPPIGPVGLEQGRRLFIDHVRADGPLPTLRVGDQPYGFLPVTPLDSWISAGDPIDGRIAYVLRAIRRVWTTAAASLPLAAQGPASLLEVLRNAGTTTGITARTLIGPLYAANLLRYVGMPEWAGWLAQRDQLGTAELRAIGIGWTPPVTRSVFAPDAYRLREPFVADTSPGYLTWLSTADPVPHASTGVLSPAAHPAALVDFVARHALGRAYADASGQIAPEGELLGFGFPGETPLALTEVSTPVITELRSALATLGATPTDVLTRHFTGTLDLASHRLDAWITAIATRRLATLRSATTQGLRVGAFGWVEGLAPRSQEPASEGWIAAPSMAHATTAAVLRNGYRSRRLAGEAPGTLAVDLSSRRVRRALRLLDEVRAGRTLAAVLGEQLERALHDAHLDPLIDRLRTFAPVAGGGSTDGLAVAQQWTDQHDLLGFDVGADGPALTPLLDSLTETLDALADLTLAEGVHQLVTGNPVRAGALFDALGRGEQPPPEIAVTTTPRRSVHHTVRLIVALPADAARGPHDWPAAPGSVRAAAEPRADAWAATFLGPASAATFTLTWTDAAGQTTETSGTLAEADLAPLDVVYLAAQPEALDPWLIRAAANSAPAGAVATVSGRPDAVIELASTLRRLLTRCRAATAADLDPNAAGPVSDAPPDPDAITRATAATRELDAGIAAAVAALANTDSSASGQIRDALVALSRFAVPQALPVDGESDDASRDRAARALDIAQRRATAASGEKDPAAVLSALFHEPFTLFGPLSTTKLSQRDPPDSANTISWLDKIGRVQPGAAALSDLLLYDESLGRSPAFALAQLPDDPTEPTLIDDAAHLTDPRHVTLIHLPQHGPLPNEAAALLVDGWVEPVPTPQETAAITFHLERPTTQPPQSCLIAVPPDPAAPWSTATLEAVLLDTLDTARMRAVPAEALTAAAQLLPALQFAFNPAGETVSTSFAGLAAQ